MSDLDIVIKAIRDAQTWCDQSDTIDSMIHYRLGLIAENIEEAVKQRQIEEHRHEPIILGLDSERDVTHWLSGPATEDTEDHCRLHCGCNGLNWGH